MGRQMSAAGFSQFETIDSPKMTKRSGRGSAPFVDAVACFLVAKRGAIGAGIGAAAEETGVGVAQDHVGVAHVTVEAAGDDQLVTPRGKAGDRRVREATLQNQGRGRIGRTASRYPARRLDRLLG